MDPSGLKKRPNFVTGICDILRGNNIEIDFRKRPFRMLFLEIIIRGNDYLDPNVIAEIFNITQEFIKESKRFR